MRNKLWRLVVVIWLAGGAVTVRGADKPRSPGIDLLDRVVPQEHAVAGNWSHSGSALQVDAVDGARISLPWEPNAEYDLEVDFTRHTGKDSVALIFVAGGKQASFDIDGWGQHLAGIQNTNGQTIRDNSTRVPDTALENGRRYTASVRVRRDHVDAVLDGKVLATYRGSGGDLSLLSLWSLPNRRMLGLGAWNSATTFHRVVVRPITGSPAMTAAAGRSALPKSPVPKTDDSSPDRNTIGSMPVSDLASLSDEFDDPATLPNWLRVYQTEQTRADQLAIFDIGRSRRGWMTLVPHAGTWYQDYRGVLVYKMVEGDFVVTAKAHTTNRGDNGAPQSNYSLAGIMVRTPRDVTPSTWRQGGENYIFLSHGSARSPGRFEFEVKTTINSKSTLEVSPAVGPDVLIQVVRVGQEFVLLRKDGNRPWEVHQRYRRPDMPRELQVGLTVYTDYATASRLPVRQQNTSVIRGGNPDLRATFDYVRYRRPRVPASLQEKSISNANEVPDAALLQLFGENAM